MLVLGKEIVDFYVVHDGVSDEFFHNFGCYRGETNWAVIFCFFGPFLYIAVTFVNFQSFDTFLLSIDFWNSMEIMIRINEKSTEIMWDHIALSVIQ